ncbi:MAG: hypothetical protein ABH950_06645, partial [Candidatus Altiarchaeota archaeon]
MSPKKGEDFSDDEVDEIVTHAIDVIIAKEEAKKLIDRRTKREERQRLEARRTELKAKIHSRLLSPKLEDEEVNRAVANLIAEVLSDRELALRTKKEKRKGWFSFIW